jgi:hypothetical protein
MLVYTKGMRLVKLLPGNEVTGRQTGRAGAGRGTLRPREGEAWREPMTG